MRRYGSPRRSGHALTSPIRPQLLLQREVADEPGNGNRVRQLPSLNARTARLGGLQLLDYRSTSLTDDVLRDRWHAARVPMRGGSACSRKLLERG